MARYPRWYGPRPRAWYDYRRRRRLRLPRLERLGGRGFQPLWRRRISRNVFYDAFSGVHVPPLRPRSAFSDRLGRGEVRNMDNLISLAEPEEAVDRANAGYENRASFLGGEEKEREVKLDVRGDQLIPVDDEARLDRELFQRMMDYPAQNRDLVDENEDENRVATPAEMRPIFGAVVESLDVTARLLGLIVRLQQVYGSDPEIVENYSYLIDYLREFNGDISGFRVLLEGFLDNMRQLFEDWMGD